MSENRFIMTQSALADLAQYALNLAKQQGATETEVGVSEAYGQSVSVRNQEIDTIEYNQDKELSVTVYLGKQKGSATSSNFSEDSVRDVVNKAISLAKYTAADEFSGLAERELMPIDETLPDLDLFYPWHISADDAIDQAKACEQAAFDESPLINNSEGASVSSHQSQFIMANSLGFCQGFQTSRHARSCHVIAGSGDMMQRDGWYDVARSHEDLMPIDAIGEKAAQRAAARLNARRIPTGAYPVLFEAPMAVGLLGHFVVATSGGNLYRKSSFLLDKLGHSIFPDFVSIEEKPHLLKGLASTPFDNDGVRTKDRSVIKNGVLQGYFLSAYSARKLGMQTTGNAGGSHNLILSNTGQSFDELLKMMNNGLIVTEVLGQGVNYVTGTYSRGVSGFWVENGQIAYPVEEITIAGNLADMFKSIVAIGNDTLVKGGKRSGSILIESMMVAGSD